MSQLITLILVVVVPLTVVGFLFQSWRCWRVLILTVIMVPIAVVLSLLATGIGHPSGGLGLAKLSLPYAVIAIELAAPADDSTAGAVMSWVPVFQIIIYGIAAAIGVHRRVAFAVLGTIALLHVLASLMAFAIHPGGYLDGR